MGVFRVWGDTWGDVWCDKEKRNVLLGVTFGVTVLTLKMDDCPPFISLFCVIDFENGRLEGGDNPTFWHVPNFCVMSEMPCLSGFCCFATLLYLCMCVRDTFCGVERVRDACDVSIRRGGRVRQ